MNKELEFLQDVANGNIVIKDIPCGEIRISHDEAMALQNCGVSLKSEFEMIADLESSLKEAI